jgi:hypothetical protein
MFSHEAHGRSTSLRPDLLSGSGSKTSPPYTDFRRGTAWHNRPSNAWGYLQLFGSSCWSEKNSPASTTGSVGLFGTSPPMLPELHGISRVRNSESPLAARREASSCSAPASARSVVTGLTAVSQSFCLEATIWMQRFGCNDPPSIRQPRATQEWRRDTRHRR